MNDAEPSHPAKPPARRRSRQSAKRPCTIRFALTDDEFHEIATAADRASQAKGAFAAQAALTAARNPAFPVEDPFRAALSEFMRAATLVRRIGVNLNQAVAKLNATGQSDAALLPYAQECLRRVQLLDEVAEEVRRRLRR